MTDPTPPLQSVINDPNYVPLAANADGDILVTEDGTVILVSTTLRVHGQNASLYRRKKFWLKAPPFNVRKK